MYIYIYIYVYMYIYEYCNLICIRNSRGFERKFEQFGYK